MAETARIGKRSLPAEVKLFCRRCVYVAVLTVCAVALFQTLVVAAFHVPSGSMAPALNGRHRICECPRCGQQVVVGRHVDDREGSGEARYYRNAFCPNCGLYPVPVADAPELPGDQIFVNKTAYWLRSPSRWEVVVFRLLEGYYIKRLLGLPGEEIVIHDGDVYINGKLMRKTLAEARGMRVLVFDQDCAPKSGWKERWEHQPGAQATEEKTPSLALRAGETLTYRHFLCDTGKCEPIRDEYAYNASVHADSECVHDFIIDTEIEATGRGEISLRLCDGHDWIEVTLPIGGTAPIEAVTWPVGRIADPSSNPRGVKDGSAIRPTEPNADRPVRRRLTESATKVSLRSNRRYHVELAFVDRHVSLAIDGKVTLTADLPEAKKRDGVERPFQASAAGASVRLHRFRLYRDVHYGQQGTNAVRGNAVRLGANQYFMLGDNSPSSEDSRYWPDGGRIDRASLIGPMMSVRNQK